jgi:hypothetical protein
MKLLCSDRLWEDIRKFVRAVFPILLLLRMTDRSDPCMDRLYFYVRNMDKTIDYSKLLLDGLSKKYDATVGLTMQDKVISYLLGEGSSLGHGYDSDADSTRNSDDGSVSTVESGKVNIWIDKDGVADLPIASSYLGASFLYIWAKRRKPLIHDVAIAGWLLSPDPTIREDVLEHTNNDHIRAMENLISKWFSHIVENVSQ